MSKDSRTVISSRRPPDDGAEPGWSAWEKPAELREPDSSPGPDRSRRPGAQRPPWALPSAEPVSRPADDRSWRERWRLGRDRGFRRRNQPRSESLAPTTAEPETPKPPRPAHAADPAVTKLARPADAADPAIAKLARPADAADPAIAKLARPAKGARPSQAQAAAPAAGKAARATTTAPSAGSAAPPARSRTESEPAARPEPPSPAEPATTAGPEPAPPATAGARPPAAAGQAAAGKPAAEPAPAESPATAEPEVAAAAASSRATTETAAPVVAAEPPGAGHAQPAQAQPAAASKAGPAPPPHADASQPQPDQWYVPDAVPSWPRVLGTTVWLWLQRRVPGRKAVPPGARGATRAPRRSLPVLIIAIFCVAVAAAVVIMFTGVLKAPRITSTTPREQAPGGLAGVAEARSLAVQYVAAQIGHSTDIGCDPVMCLALKARGFPGANLVEITQDTSDPLGATVVIATTAVRNQFGSKLASVYAPQVLASYGAGASRIDIRAVVQTQAGQHTGGCPARRPGRPPAAGQLAAAQPQSHRLAVRPPSAAGRPG